jgi:hypothetical protein
MSDPISIWTIYDRPEDFPMNCIARRFEIVDGKVTATNQVIVASSLAAIRLFLVRYYGELHCVPRTDEDMTSVVETWI